MPIVDFGLGEVAGRVRNEVRNLLLETMGPVGGLVEEGPPTRLIEEFVKAIEQGKFSPLENAMLAQVQYLINLLSEAQQFITSSGSSDFKRDLKTLVTTAESIPANFTHIIPSFNYQAGNLEHVVDLMPDIVLYVLSEGFEELPSDLNLTKCNELMLEISRASGAFSNYILDDPCSWFETDHWSKTGLLGVTFKSMITNAKRAAGLLIPTFSFLESLIPDDFSVTVELTVLAGGGGGTEVCGNPLQAALRGMSWILNLFVQCCDIILKEAAVCATTKRLEEEKQFRDNVLAKLPASSDSLSYSEVSPLLRFHNNNHHFCTTPNTLVPPAGYNYELAKCFVRKNPGVGCEPLHCVYFQHTDDHIYTVDVNEKNRCVSDGAEYKGIVGYVKRSPSPELVPLYRRYHSGTFDRIFTSDQTEANNLVTNLGYHDEGVIAYVWRLS